MTVRTRCLAASAGVALAIALSVPAIATELGPNGPQESTPAEKAQTQDLNRTQQNGSYVDPAVANGQATAGQATPADGVAAAAGNTANDDAQYQAQQQQYRENQEHYADQQDRYSQERTAYEHQRAAYDWQRRHPATWWHYRYQNASLDAFYTLDRPALMNVAVTDRDGFLVGHITDVVHSPSGRVARVLITLDHGRGAWIEARNLRYFADDRMIMIDLTPSQIWDRSMTL